MPGRRLEARWCVSPEDCRRFKLCPEALVSDRHTGDASLTSEALRASSEVPLLCTDPVSFLAK